MADHLHLGEKERKRSKVMGRFLAETKKNELGNSEGGTGFRGRGRNDILSI